MSSLLVTNDFPPKIGGIQSYLYELWRRLPPEDATVLTTPHAGAAAFDAAQAFEISRTRERVLIPTAALTRRVEETARRIDAATILLDPMLPLGRIGAHLRAAPHVVILHGAEVNLPGRLPGSRALARGVLERADAVIAGGGYPARVATEIAGRPLTGVIVPPGVDVDRFHPLDDAARRAARIRLGFDPDRPLIVGVSRLVPRKGFDVLIDAVAALGRPDVQVAIGGTGRDRRRLELRARYRGIASRVRFLGRIDAADLPALYGAADVFTMLCRERWRGLEAEGFGIVFLEAAACGVPSIAGRSGGAAEAVADGETGYVVDPHDVGAVVDRLRALLDDGALRLRFGVRARRRAVEDFAYDRLALRLLPVVQGHLGGLAPLDP